MRPYRMSHHARWSRNNVGILAYWAVRGLSVRPWVKGFRDWRGRIAEPWSGFVVGTDRRVVSGSVTVRLARDGDLWKIGVEVWAGCWVRTKTMTAGPLHRHERRRGPTRQDPGGTRTRFAGDYSLIRRRRPDPPMSNWEMLESVEPLLKLLKSLINEGTSSCLPGGIGPASCRPRPEFGRLVWRAPYWSASSGRSCFPSSRFTWHGKRPRGRLMLTTA